MSVDLLRRLSCDARLGRVLMNQHRVPIDIGRDSRIIYHGQRKALRHRDNGCRFPGCDAPHRWTEAHHNIHWADGGETNLNNLVSLCRHHHRLVHHDGWTIDMTRADENIIEFHAPGTAPPDRQTQPCPGHH